MKSFVNMIQGYVGRLSSFLDGVLTILDPLVAFADKFPKPLTNIVLDLKLAATAALRIVDAIERILETVDDLLPLGD